MNIIKGFLKALPIVFVAIGTGLIVNALYYFFGVVPNVVLLIVGFIALVVEFSNEQKRGDPDDK